MQYQGSLSVSWSRARSDVRPIVSCGFTSLNSMVVCARWSLPSIVTINCTRYSLLPRHTRCRSCDSLALFTPNIHTLLCNRYPLWTHSEWGLFDLLCRRRCTTRPQRSIVTFVLPLTAALPCIVYESSSVTLTYTSKSRLICINRFFQYPKISSSSRSTPAGISQTA